MAFNFADSEPVSSAGKAAKKASRGGSTSPESMFLQFLGASSGNSTNLDRMAGGMVAGIPGVISGSRNIEDAAPLAGYEIGRGLGLMAGHPILGGAAGAGALEAGRQGIKALRREVAGSDEEVNPLGNVAATAGSTALIDGGISLVTKGPFMKELLNKSLGQARSALFAKKGEIANAGLKVSRDEVLGNLSEHFADVRLPSEVRKAQNWIFKELEGKGDIPVQKLIDLSEKLNGIYGGLKKSKISGTLKNAMGQSRHYLSQLIKSKADEAGIKGVEEAFKQVNQINNKLKFFGGPAGGTGTVVGEISGLGALGGLIGGPKGAMMGGIAGAALSNPLVRNIVLAGLESTLGKISQEGLRAVGTEFGRQVSRE